MNIITEGKSTHEKKQEVSLKEPKKVEKPEEFDSPVKREVEDEDNKDDEWKFEVEDDLNMSDQLDNNKAGTFQKKIEDDDEGDEVSSEVENTKSSRNKYVPKGKRDRSFLNAYIDDLRGVNQEGTLACKICQKTFNTMEKVRNHLNRGHKVGAEFKCEVCSKPFVYERDLGLHMNVHNGLKPFVCDICGADFKWEVSVNRHKIVAHGTEEEKASIKRFMCTVCNRKCETLGLLKEHELTHSKEKTFLCTQCDKSFYTTQTLRYHTKVYHEGHSPKKPTEKQREYLRAYMMKKRAQVKAEKGGVCRTEEEKIQFNEYMRQWNAKKRLESKKNSNEEYGNQ